MKTLHVRAVRGRVAFDAPSGGKRIPDDRYVAVRATPWIMRLLDEHGDIQVQAPPPPVAQQAKRKDAPSS
jgi:hypothetical protein